MEIGDEIAYNNHDMDDGLSSGMIEPDMMKDVELWRENFKEVKKAHENVDFKILKYQTIVRIINAQVTDLVSNISSTLEEEGIISAADVRKKGKPVACFSRPMITKNVELRKFLRKNLYEHYRLARMADKAERMLEGLFNAYMRESRLLPPHFFSHIESIGKERLICDYIAGMTDRFALDEYKKLFDPYEKV